MRNPGVLPVSSPPPGMEIGLLYGQKPDSKEEWWIGAALWELGWTFDFQEIAGGVTRLLGTTVIDFLVHTVPKATPLFYDGPYYHGQAQVREQDHMKRVLLWQQNQNRYNMPIVVPSEDYNYVIGDYEEAEQAMLDIFGLGPNA